MINFALHFIIHLIQERFINIYKMPPFYFISILIELNLPIYSLKHLHFYASLHSISIMEILISKPFNNFNRKIKKKRNTYQSVRLSFCIFFLQMDFLLWPHLTPVSGVIYYFIFVCIYSLYNWTGVNV